MRSCADTRFYDIIRIATEADASESTLPTRSLPPDVEEWQVRSPRCDHRERSFAPRLRRTTYTLQSLASMSC